MWDQHWDPEYSFFEKLAPLIFLEAPDAVVK
jgi:hypothetical protein